MFARQNLAVLLLLVFATVTGPLAALAVAEPGGVDGPVLVIARDAPELIADAGGRLLGPASAPWASLAEVDETALERLAESAAVAILDARFLAALCVTDTE